MRRDFFTLDILSWSKPRTEDNTAILPNSTDLQIYPKWALETGRGAPSVFYTMTAKQLYKDAAYEAL